MAHPLEDVMASADGFVLIGDSSEARFPGQSFHCYTEVGRKFYCIDLGGLTESRGGTKGKKVYNHASELPDDRGDLAIVWLKPRSATRGVEMAKEAGCTKIWFSFQTGHPTAVERARELGLEVVEIGRCPVYYMKEMTPVCRAHTALVKLSGSYKKAPQTVAGAKNRELF